MKSFYDELIEESLRQAFRTPSPFKTRRLTVCRVAQEREFTPYGTEKVRGAMRCSVGLRASDGSVRVEDVPCETIGTYRVGDVYQERIEKA